MEFDQAATCYISGILCVYIYTRDLIQIPSGLQKNLCKYTTCILQMCLQKFSLISQTLNNICPT